MKIIFFIDSLIMLFYRILIFFSNLRPHEIVANPQFVVNRIEPDVIH